MVLAVGFRSSRTCSLLMFNPALRGSVAADYRPSWGTLIVLFLSGKPHTMLTNELLALPSPINCQSCIDGPLCYGGEEEKQTFNQIVLQAPR